MCLFFYKSRQRLQHLEKRMFEYAAKQDYKKASQFQEQFRILMEDAGVDKPTSAATKPSKVGGHWAPPMPMPVPSGPPIAFAYHNNMGGYYGDGYDGYDDHADY